MRELSEVDRSTRRRRRLGLVLVPAAVLLLAATGFTTYRLLREPTHLETIGYYASASTSGDTTIVNADGRDPRVICAELWAQGAVGEGPAPEELAACVLETGPVGVFPSSGPNTCEELGLAELPASYAAEGKRFAELRDALVRELATRCADEAAARELVRRELAARGYAGWQVDVAGEGFREERPCASVSFDGERKVVLLVAVEPVEIACYGRAELPADFVAVRADGRDPVAVCDELWREGGLRGEQPAVACLLHGAYVGVFPSAGPGTCSKLGLDEL